MRLLGPLERSSYLGGKKGKTGKFWVGGRGGYFCLFFALRVQYVRKIGESDGIGEGEEVQKGGDL